MAARARAGADIDCHALVRGRIVNQIAAAAALQRVGTTRTDQRVVLRAAIDQVGVAIADEGVGSRRAEEVADARQGIALRIAADAGAGAEVDRDGLAGTRIGRRIDAARAAAIERIGAEATGQRVVAAAAVDQVGIDVTRQRIVLGRAENPGNAGQDVILRCATGPGAGAEVDRDGLHAETVVDSVIAATALQRVGAKPTRQRVVATTTVQQVRSVIAGQQVIVGRPDDGGNVDEGIVLRIATLVDARSDVDGQGERRARIVSRVESAAADERVGTDSTRERVVATAAVQQIAGTVTDQRVILARSGEVGDARQDIRLGIAASREAGSQIDRDGLERRGVVRRVGVATTIERVGAGPTRKGVRARPTVEEVVVRIAGQQVVLPGARREANAGEHVAIGMAADTGACRQVDRDREV